MSGLVVSGVGPRGEDPEGQDRWARVARALRERRHAEGVALAAEAMGTRPDVRGALAQVDAPVLVLAGAADRAVPAEVQRELSAWMTNARFHVVREAGHNVAVERPNELVSAIRSLARSRRSPSPPRCSRAVADSLTTAAHGWDGVRPLTAARA